MGGGSVPTDSSEFVEEFFSKTPEDPAGSWAPSRRRRKRSSPRSWPTSAAASRLSRRARRSCRWTRERHLRGCGSAGAGAAGPACAEYLLQLGYAVIFVHREDSLRPFTRHFQKYLQNGAFMDMFRLQDNGLVLSGVDITQQLQIQKIAQLYTECSTRCST
ncbi:hypothetical protein KRP22_000492 [Phytophthora ramorum]|nr:hypothetical protein KRP22_12438 [Phytophthora ramorum]